MSHISSTSGYGFAAGYFLKDDENCVRETMTIAYNHAQAVTRNGRTIVPMGAIIPSNDQYAKGILYEDVDVTNGDHEASVVTAGTIYLDKLPKAAESAAKSAMANIVQITSSPSVVRPEYYDRASLGAITVESAAGTAQGDTAITVSGYTPKAYESYVYKVATGTAPAVALGDDLSSGWTAWDGTTDITAATDKKITIASVDSTAHAVAAGNATVTAKA